MAHYKYSPEHLDFIKVRRSAWQLLRMAFLYFMGSVVLAMAYYAVFSTFFNTP